MAARILSHRSLRQARRRPTALELDFPNEKSGVRGMRFVEAMVASARDGNTWKKV